MNDNCGFGRRWFQNMAALGGFCSSPLCHTTDACEAAEAEHHRSAPRRSTKWLLAVSKKAFALAIMPSTANCHEHHLRSQSRQRLVRAFITTHTQPALAGAIPHAHHLSKLREAPVGLLPQPNPLLGPVDVDDAQTSSREAIK